MAPGLCMTCQLWITTIGAEVDQSDSRRFAATDETGVRDMRVHVVDTFTRQMFRGNPTGVVLFDQPVDSGWMQAVAAEFNHPATAFADVSKSNARPRQLRWFSPTTELTLCGSGTLGAGHVLC